MKTGLRVGSVKLNSRETEKTKTEADSLDISRAYYTEHDFKSNDQFCRIEVINNEKYSLYNQERKVYFIIEPNGARKSRKLSFLSFYYFLVEVYNALVKCISLCVVLVNSSFCLCLGKL